MSITVAGESLSGMADALARLARDVEHLREYGCPSEAMLRAAPILNCWDIALAGPVNCLVGSVSGHPRLGTRPFIHTSELFAIDPVAGWARTWSRFYLLGVPKNLAGGGHA